MERFIGHTVVVQEDGLRRRLWKLGQVEGLTTGKGLVRGAVV